MSVACKELGERNSDFDSNLRHAVSAIVVYRLPWTWRCSKLMMKFIHAGLHSLAFILVLIALLAVFDFHNEKRIPNMYSLHSWVGLAAVVLYALQVSDPGLAILNQQMAFVRRDRWYAWTLPRKIKEKFSGMSPKTHLTF